MTLSTCKYAAKNLYSAVICNMQYCSSPHLVHYGKTDIIQKVKHAKVELTEIELTEIELTKVKCAKVELPEIKITEIELTEAHREGVGIDRNDNESENDEDINADDEANTEIFNNKNITIGLTILDAISPSSNYSERFFDGNHKLTSICHKAFLTVTP
ncbi:hypothetical protein BC936DRAFT_150043 [Jimgerdemannia flammicorona]|uniref:Uncharacterized protein n=1 Tax=Jimgerdemannia flammicorona TaxID=994334 RepID=A0A433CZL8_9FUNG|nr:hypothetical protein BC936DRAFT_150043 [Jimgerdemannia flammicorona]